MNKVKALEVSSKLAFEKLRRCGLCPRKCGVDRTKGQKGFCGASLNPVVYSYFPHHGEEPPISGKNGSGAIFFTYCTLRCVYCQNYSFSQLSNEKEITTGELSRIMLDLEKQGCHNINLVSPTHFIWPILEALLGAVKKGLDIPVVYNTSGYELAETLKLLEGIVDIYLPDMRYGNDEAAKKFSDAPDYVARNQDSIKEMRRQAGDLVTDTGGIAQKGLIVRHLVLPNGVASADAIFKFVSTVSKRIHISLMSQYHPVYRAPEFPEINRRVTKAEYKEATDALFRYGLFNGWLQDADEKISSALLGTNIKQRARGS